MGIRQIAMGIRQIAMGIRQITMGIRQITMGIRQITIVICHHLIAGNLIYRIADNLSICKLPPLDNLTMANSNTLLAISLLMIVLVVMYIYSHASELPASELPASELPASDLHASDLHASHFRGRAYEQTFEDVEESEEVTTRQACSVADMYPKREMLPTCKQDCRVSCRYPYLTPRDNFQSKPSRPSEKSTFSPDRWQGEPACVRAMYAPLAYVADLEAKALMAVNGAY